MYSLILLSIYLIFAAMIFGCCFRSSCIRICYCVPSCRFTVCHNFPVVTNKFIIFILPTKHLGLSKHWLAVRTQVVLSIISISVSIWLLYLQVGVHNFCVICLALFVINISIVALALIRHERLRLPASGDSGSSSSSGSGATQKKKAPAAKKGRAKKD